MGFWDLTKEFVGKMAETGSHMSRYVSEYECKSSSELHEIVRNGGSNGFFSSDNSTEERNGRLYAARKVLHDRGEL